MAGLRGRIGGLAGEEGGGGAARTRLLAPGAAKGDVAGRNRVVGVELRRHLPYPGTLWPATTTCKWVGMGGVGVGRR